MPYTRAVFARLRDPGAPITLAEIPLDAPYLGPPETVLWAWSEVSEAWIPHARWVMQPAPAKTLAEALAEEPLL